MSNTLRPFLLFLTVAAAFFVGLEAIRPLPFTTTDDNWMSELALIKAHTDATLAGAPLRMLWSLGAGWDPFESAQRGLFYPPYHLANLIARALGEPLWLLEVSGALHLFAAGVITFLLGDRRWSSAERVAFALAAVVLPGPLLLGLNWHDYLAPVPWFLGLALVLRRNLDANEPWSRRDRLLFFALSVLMFMAAHVQMYVLGYGLLAAWALVERRDIPFLLSTGAVFAACQLPFLIPMALLLEASGSATTSWMAGRQDPGFLLHHAQPLATVLPATLVGNTFSSPSFHIWGGVEQSAVGMFFNIPLLFCLAVSVLRRRWLLCGFTLACLMFLAAKDFPFLRYLAHGPLGGFRWTWKLTMWTGPLFLVAAMRLLPGVVGDVRRRALIVSAVVAASALVCVRGVSFDLLPALRIAHPLGATRIVEEAQRCFSSAGLAPGTRLALIGQHDMVRPLPLPVLTMLGNAPLLAGYESAHLFEPLEDAQAAEGHLGLSLPWRVGIPAEEYLVRAQEIDAALAAIGVQGVVTAYGDIFPEHTATRCEDAIGGHTWVKKLPQAVPFSYPWAEVSGERVPLERLRDGRLLYSGSEAEPPVAMTPRHIEWRRSANGDWVGAPEPIGAGWVLGALLLTLLALSVLASNRCARMWTRPSPDDATRTI